jgi:hypothetical protein
MQAFDYLDLRFLEIMLSNAPLEKLADGECRASSAFLSFQRDLSFIDEHDDLS